MLLLGRMWSYKGIDPRPPWSRNRSLLLLARLRRGAIEPAGTGRARVGGLGGLRRFARLIPGLVLAKDVAIDLLVEALDCGPSEDEVDGHVALLALARDRADIIKVYSMLSTPCSDVGMFGRKVSLEICCQR